MYDEFKECLRSSPAVKEILAEWDLSLEPKQQRISQPIILYDSEKKKAAGDAQKKSPWNILSIFSR
jgi:hypothetical protein